MEPSELLEAGRLGYAVAFASAPTATGSVLPQAPVSLSDLDEITIDELKQVVTSTSSKAELP